MFQIFLPPVPPDWIRSRSFNVYSSRYRADVPPSMTSLFHFFTSLVNFSSSSSTDQIRYLFTSNSSRLSADVPPSMTFHFFTFGIFSPSSS
ncbi:hypothetical protein AVEN_245374-1 [Araneus ventricosus]|uniref:Uncharacterized protein n=1 Tax=Araneus ventricosus TaxID=182803 RepID=A0A4Y2VAH4_ARAVE|nr:hypothetical protein AVEN_245374-1 [Araneus ventricosus]